MLPRESRVDNLARCAYGDGLKIIALLFKIKEDGLSFWGTEVENMATAKQIQFRLDQQKKKLEKLNKEATALSNKMKLLEAQLKRAKSISKTKSQVSARPLVSFFSPRSFSKSRGRTAIKRKFAARAKRK